MSKSTDALIAELSSAREAAREAAIARLAVIGARAVDRLMQLASSAAPPLARIAALQTLERIGDRRALTPALALTGDADPEVALAAIAVARVFVKGRHGVQAVDRLTSIAVDRGRPAAIRAAAMAALKDLGATTIAPLVKELAHDQALQSADTAAARATVAASADAPLATLVHIIEDIRQREQTAPAGERADWTAVRGEAHAILARRGSRVALYDLRETIERAATPLPIAFTSAMALVGEASCLEPIAAAYARARDVRWKKQLADAFRAIVKRDRITRRHAAMKKAQKRAPELVSTL